MFSLIKKASAVFAIAAVLLTGPVAAAAGQIEGGNFYRSKNVTTNGNYGDVITADKCQTVQYLVQIHNPGPETINNVTVKATLPSTASTSISSVATISSPDANPTSQTDTATVNLPAAYKAQYVAGSTQLLDHNAALLQSLPDGVVGGGVSVPNGVGVSLQEIRYVRFQAKIDCPETPGCTVNCAPETPKTPVTPTGVTPGAIASTGPADVISGLAGVSALGYGVQRYVASRRQQ